MRRIIFAAGGPLLLALVALSVITVNSAQPAAAATKRKAKTVKVKVGDNYYAPVSTKIHVGDKIKFIWPEISDTHDVVLQKKNGPKKAKTFASPSFAGYKLTWTTNPKKKQLTTPGSYKLICSFHNDMTFKVKVLK